MSTFKNALPQALPWEPRLHWIDTYNPQNDGDIRHYTDLLANHYLDELIKETQK